MSAVIFGKNTNSEPQLHPLNPEVVLIDGLKSSIMEFLRDGKFCVP